MLTVRQLLAGDNAGALYSARKAAAADDDMGRLERELDGS
jgi:hypothetical protein